jgi:LysR family cyn operon transcriptional activator
MESYVRSFLSVYKTGAINRTAALLHKSEPAISYQIRSLEASCGKRLFDRVGRRIVPNQYGRELYQVVEPMLASFDAAVSNIRGEALGKPMAFNIATVNGFGRYVLAPAMTLLEAPSFRLLFGTAEETWDAVKTGKADIGFTFKRTFDRWLRFSPIYEEEIVLVSNRPMHKMTLQKICKFPFITYEEGDWVFSKWFEEVWEQQPANIRSIHHMDELEEVLTFVRAGHGLSIVPFDAARRLVRQNALHVYRRGWRRCVNSVFLVQRTTGQPSGIVDSITEVLRSANDCI